MSKPNHDPAMTRHVSFGPLDGRKLPCDPRRRTEYVEDASGLRLRLTPSGARSWAVSFWSALAKAMRRLKLGNAATVSLKDARELARAALAEKDKGRDPYLERRGAKDEERKARETRAEGRRQNTRDRERRTTTFGKVVRAYVEDRRTTEGGRFGRKATPTTISSWMSMLKHLGPVESVPPEDLRTAHLIRVIEGAIKNGGPSMGPRMREFTAQAWRWMEPRAEGLGVRLPDISPLRGLPKIGGATVERERALTPSEVWRFWHATETDADELAGLSLRFMLVTACRVKESTHLPTAELDLGAKTWTLGASRNKGGRVRVVPLSDQALALLKRAQTIHKGTHVFGPVRGLDQIMKRLNTAMECEPWQSRDLRRTSATIAGRLGFAPFEVGLLLGHKHPDASAARVTSTYNKWGYAEKLKDILTCVGEWVEETVTATKEPGAVAEFRR